MVREAPAMHDLYDRVAEAINTEAEQLLAKRMRCAISAAGVQGKANRQTCALSSHLDVQCKAP
eukprot:7782247-Pyramimonas_sp.AAC.1